MIADLGNLDMMGAVYKAVKETVKDSALVNYSSMLCGIFALVYYANQILNTWGRGRELDILSLAKPIVVVFFIFNFNLVTDTLDACIADPLSNATMELKDNNNNYITTKDIEHQAQQSTQWTENYKTGDEEDAPSFWDMITKGVELLIGFFTSLLLWLMNLISITICLVARFCLYMYSIILRTILYVFGPLAFAFSVFPYFKDNIKNWLGKYIGACLYVPVTTLICFIQETMTHTFCSEMAKDMAQTSGVLGTRITLWLVLPCCIIIL